MDHLTTPDPDAAAGQPTPEPAARQPYHPPVLVDYGPLANRTGMPPPVSG